MRILLLLLLFISPAASISAQNFPSLQFSHLTTKEGLSSNNATCIAEDKTGFIWVGTTNGLNRYDGYRFKHYYHSSADTNSVVSNSIQTLYSDSKGRLWITTSDGVSCFMHGNNKFINYSTLLNVPHKLKNNSSVRIYEDEQGNIWLCNQLDVIYKINEAMQAEAVPVSIPSFSFFLDKKFGYDNIFRDMKGNEWAFTANHIYALNKKSKQVEKTFDFSATLQTNILKMLQDTTGAYYASTWGSGLLRFYPETGKLVAVASLPKRIFVDMTRFLFHRKEWLVSLEVNYGLYLMDATTQTAKNYGFIMADPSSLHGTDYNQAFTDKKGNLWIGSNSGLNLLKTTQSLVDVFPVTDPGTSNYSSYKSGPVQSYLETDSSIWVAKRYVSTFELSKDFSIKSFYSSFYPLSSGAYSSNGYSFYFLKKGNDIFISTDSGLAVLNTVSKKIDVFFVPESLLKTGLRTIVPLSDSELLVRSYDDGLYIFNVLQKRFTKHYSNEMICSTCPSLKLSYLFLSSQNEIYLCCRGQLNNLYRYIKKDDQFLPVQFENGKDQSFLAADIFSMAEDAEHHLWIASTNGVFIYDPLTNKLIKKLEENKEMASLFRICFDNAGNLWANCASGIYCYITKTGKWMGFDNSDGLPGSDFEGIIAKRPDGDIIAGLEGAVAIFHPAQLFKQTNEPPVIITEANTADSSFAFPLLNNSTKELTLRPWQNSFSVDFALLSYINTASAKYYYRLEPLMNDFQQNDNGHVNFNGLAPGTYLLHVKGGNKAGLLFEKEDVLTISVLPRWYQTVWFKILVIAGMIAMVYGFVRWRIRNVKSQAELKQKIAETEMQSLRSQMNPHFIFNSLNSIENFIMQNEKRLASDYLNKFSRLIRIILESSKDELVPLSKDMEALQLYIELEQLRFSNKFSYHTHIDEELLSGNYKVPPLLIQPYVENAIIHGFAHSDQKNHRLNVSANIKDDYVIYVIEDDGVGREKAAAYNTLNKPKHKSVGMQITEERIKLHNKETGEAFIKITDLTNTGNNTTGTRVEVIIKIN